jgi:tetratricopeptide (TPR) repeat protein
VLSSLILLLAAANVAAQARTNESGALNQSDDQEARELFRLGKQAFDEGRYERALKYFNDAYELSHRAGLLSNIGTALDRLRRDREALAAYQSYLQQVPDAPNRAAIEDRIRIIQAATREPGPNATVPQAVETQAVPTPAETARAQLATQAAPAPATQPTTDRDQGGVLTRWWFWAGVGTVAAAAIIVGVAASSGGGSAMQPAAVVGANTRVHEL